MRGICIIPMPPMPPIPPMPPMPPMPTHSAPCHRRWSSWWPAASAFFVGFGDDGLGGEEQAGHGGGVLQGGAVTLVGSTIAGGEHVALACRSRRCSRSWLVLDFWIWLTTTAPSMPAFSAIERAGCSSARADDLDADGLVAFELQALERGPASRISGGAAAGDDAFLDRRAGGVQASSTRALRSFISVSVAAPTLIWATPPASLASRSWSFSRSYSLSVWSISRRIISTRGLRSSLVRAGAFDDRGVLAVDRDLLGQAQVGELDACRARCPRSLKIALPPVRIGDVAEHGLAAVAVAGGLDGGDLEDAAQLVDDQGREGLAVDVLGDDQQRLDWP